MWIPNYSVQLSSCLCDIIAMVRGHSNHDSHEMEVSCASLQTLIIIDKISLDSSPGELMQSTGNMCTAVSESHYTGT